jgi:hypothetical protein
MKGGLDGFTIRLVQFPQRSNSFGTRGCLDHLSVSGMNG